MYQIGIDIGGTNTLIGIVDDNGAIVRTRSMLTQAGRPQDDIIADMASAIGTLLKEVGIGREEVEAVGVGVPGAVDSCSGVVVGAYNLQWRNVPLKDEMEKILQRPVYVENGANVAAIAELMFGVFKGCHNALLLTLATGLGSALIINGKLYRGSHNVGNEAGHMTLVEDGLQCTCGNKGCMEMYVTATALVREGRKAVIEQPMSMISSMTGGNFSLVTAKLVMDCAKKHDLVAYGIFRQYVHALGSSIASICNMLDPDIIAIGGGVSKSGEFLLKPLREDVSKKLFFKNVPPPRIEIAAMGNEAGVIGAAKLCKMQ